MCQMLYHPSPQHGTLYLILDLLESQRVPPPPRHPAVCSQCLAVTRTPRGGCHPTTNQSLHRPLHQSPTTNHSTDQSTTNHFTNQPINHTNQSPNHQPITPPITNHKPLHPTNQSIHRPVHHSTDRSTDLCRGIYVTAASLYCNIDTDLCFHHRRWYVLSSLPVLSLLYSSRSYLGRTALSSAGGGEVGDSKGRGH